MKPDDFRNVALILPLFSEYARNVRQGVSNWVDKHGGWRLIELNRAELTEINSMIDQFDGVIMYLPQGDPLAEDLRAWGGPTIPCGLGPEREEIRARDRWPRVTYDIDSISQLAIRHFQKLGSECVGYVAPQLWNGNKRDRRVAKLRSDVLAAGMEWVEYDFGDLTPNRDPSLIWRAGSDQALRDFIARLPPATGLLADDDTIGMWLCETARKLGLKIPGDVAVLGQGNRLIGRSGPIPLSTVVIPGVEVGREAAAALDQWMAGNRPTFGTLRLPCTRIVVRKSTGGRSGDLAVERAIRHLDTHAIHGVTLEELAGVANYSTRTLREKLRETHGIEVADELRRRRLEEAIRLLTSTNLDVAEIGKQCGFPSPSSFSNFIQRQTGMGPAQYRQWAKTKGPSPS